jgi:hypothetical protein
MAGLGFDFTSLAKSATRLAVLAASGVYLMPVT